MDDKGAIVSTRKNHIDYFDRDIDDRRELSRRARERGARFDPETRKQAFSDAFHSLLDEIEA